MNTAAGLRSTCCGRSGDMVWSIQWVFNEEVSRMPKKIIGMYLILVAVLVGVHTVVEPLYHVSTEARP